MTQELIDKIELALHPFKQSDIMEYIAGHYEEEILEEIGDVAIMEYITEEVSLDTILESLDKEEVAIWLDESSEISGYIVVKTESLKETQQVESHLKRVGRY